MGPNSPRWVARKGHDIGLASYTLGKYAKRWSGVDDVAIKGVAVVAKYSYAAHNDDELSFKKGERFALLEKSACKPATSSRSTTEQGKAKTRHRTTQQGP
jgi:hypothetical protein